MSVSRAQFKGVTKTLFVLLCTAICCYAYIFVPYIRWGYDGRNGVETLTFVIYCYQVAHLTFEQVYLYLIIYQVKNNLGFLKSSNLTSNVRVTLEMFEVNLEVYQQISQFFGFMITTYLFNLLIGLTIIVFVGFVQNQIGLMLLEHLLWDCPFLIMVFSVKWMHQASYEVMQSKYVFILFY